jgi:hypothetical protein
MHEPAVPLSLDTLAERLALLDAERAVRATMTDYMARCDVPDHAGDGSTLAELFAPDAIWEGVGPRYARQFGCLRGPAAITGMLRRYLPPASHFSANVHCLTSESIVVDAARSTAQGRWILLQASRYANGDAELIAARLHVDFVPAANRPAWLIRHFRTERLMDGPWPLTSAVAS